MPNETFLRFSSRAGKRRVRIVTAALGALFLAAALPLAAFLFIDSIGYRYWPADAQIEGGRAAREVTVGAGETFLLWKVTTFQTPDCSVTAIPSGEDIPLSDVSSEGWLRGGGAVPYDAFAEGRSESTRVSVSCAPTSRSPYDGDEPVHYYVDEPDGPPFLDGLGPWWPVPIALMAGGLTLMSLAAVMRSRRGRSSATG